jgi:hypothetical protein
MKKGMEMVEEWQKKFLYFRNIFCLKMDGVFCGMKMEFGGVLVGIRNEFFSGIIHSFMGGNFSTGIFLKLG